MQTKPRFNITSFCNMCLIITFILFLMTILASYSFAGGYFIDGTLVQDYLNAPAVGSNVVGYMIGDYIDSKGAHLHLFVKKCECLKRVDYKYEGVFYSYIKYITKEEFDALTPEVLVGTIDPDGQLSRDLAAGQELIAVVDRVLEYQKLDNQFVARVSIKFINLIP